MRYVSLFGVAVLAACLAGCSTSPAVKYNEEVVKAHAALANGRTGEANEHVLRAKEAVKDTKLDTRLADLLLAEARLREGKPEEAAKAAGVVLAKDERDPRANEVLGKARLQGGEFDKAEECFQRAKAGYKDEADRQRVEDLITLARGFAAYSAGDLAVAKRYWQDMKSVELRHSVDVAVKTEVERANLAR